MRTATRGDLSGGRIKEANLVVCLKTSRMRFAWSKQLPSVVIVMLGERDDALNA